MSISGALSTALSGLRANTRDADLVATNIANARTPGFAPRQLQLAAQADGGGVKVLGVRRNLDPGLLGARRLAESAQGAAETRAQAARRIESAIGAPGETGSLSARLNAFETAMIAAGNRPESLLRLETGVQTAKGLADGFNAIARDIDSLRAEADADIGGAVKQINAGLREIADLNDRVLKARVTGRETAGFEDRRQQAIDALAELVPLREVPRANGTIALITTGGALLLDGRAAEFSFTAANAVPPGATLAGGQLSGVSLDGRNLAIPGDGGPLGGGRLGALFDLRDRLGPEAIVALDAVARDLAERFQAPGIDPTLPPGGAGLFTDAGARVDPVPPPGLAGRLSVNAVIDPAQGGAVFRLRDGLGAAAPGVPGNGSLLQSLANTLSELRPPATGTGVAGDAAEQVAGLLSSAAQSRLALERDLGSATSERDELTRQELARGVDSDAEMQRLLLIEQAFSANARVIQTLDDMMQTLLRI